MVRTRLLPAFLSALLAFAFCVPVAYADSSVQAADFTVETAAVQSTTLPITGYSVKQVSCGGTSFRGAALTSDGSLWYWGSANSPTKFMSDVAQVEVIPDHMVCGFAAVKSDGSLWYYSEYETGYQTPTKIMDGVKQVSVSLFGLAAVKTDGTLWVWGSNYPDSGSNRDGALGAGSDAVITAPKKIMNDVSLVRLGSGFGGAIKKDGSLWMWGDNNQGCVGNGSTESVLSPVKVLDSVVDLRVGGYNYSGSVALKSDGSVWAWGSGLTSNDESKTPVQILTGANQIALSDGGSYGAAIKANGELWLWGNPRGSGVFGDSTYSYHSARKMLDGVSAVAPAQNHVAAVKTDGTVWAWGGNGTGQIGNGTTSAVSAPTKIMSGVSSAMTGMTQAGNSYTLAIGTTGDLWSWGQGPTGSGSSSVNAEPQQIFKGTADATTGGTDTAAGTDTTAGATSLAAKATLTLSEASYTYDGKAKEPGVTVKVGSSALRAGADYTVAYKDNVNAGTASVTVTGKGSYSGTLTKTFTIAKASNSMKVSGKTASAKHSKKKAVKVKASKAYKFAAKGQGTVTYARVAKGSSKWLKVNPKTGAITVKKGAPKKTHKVKVKISAGDANHATVSKTVTVKVKVK